MPGGCRPAGWTWAWQSWIRPYLSPALALHQSNELLRQPSGAIDRAHQFSERVHRSACITASPKRDCRAARGRPSTPNSTRWIGAKSRPSSWTFSISTRAKRAGMLHAHAWLHLLPDGLGRGQGVISIAHGEQQHSGLCVQIVFCSECIRAAQARGARRSRIPARSGSQPVAGEVPAAQHQLKVVQRERYPRQHC